MRRQKIYDAAFMRCYRELYANSTPPASFDKLVEDAKLDDSGRKVIDFMAYSIDEDLANSIIKDTCKMYKLTKYESKAFNTGILLGCSPKFIKNEKDRDAREGYRSIGDDCQSEKA